MQHQITISKITVANIDLFKPKKCKQLRLQVNAVASAIQHPDAKNGSETLSQKMANALCDTIADLCQKFRNKQDLNTYLVFFIYTARHQAMLLLIVPCFLKIMSKNNFSH